MTTQGDPALARPEPAEPPAGVPTDGPPEPPLPSARPGRQRRPRPTPAPPEDAADPPVPTAGDPADPDDPPPADLDDLVGALTALRGTVASTRYALPLPSAEPAHRITAGIVGQLDDYLLPRLRRLDAPLLVVVGGSTGAGKSTLVNSFVRAPVSPAGVLRPTTRAPVLVCHPYDATWFTESHLLPGLMRTTSRPSSPDTLQVVSAPALAPGLAFLDAPDIDSVVDANRALATQLLAAADLWLFVTTAARYADAVPWELLQAARNRGTAIALLLDRVPPTGAEAVRDHFAEMLRAHGLAGAPLFVLPETTLDGQGLLTERIIAPLRDWFGELARSAAARAAVVRQTVGGAITALSSAVDDLVEAADDQVSAAEALTNGVRAAYRAAQSTVEQGIRDGALLRGEVLARWQELVGTGDMMRAVQARVGRLRDRVAAAVTGRSTPGGRFTEALESGLVTLVRSAAADAAEQAASAWRLHPAGAALLDRARYPDGDAALDLTAASPDLSERADRLVRDWQHGVLDLVRTEAGGKRVVAKVSAYTVNATGLLVTIGVFASTSFIPTGLEVAVAGSTTVAAQVVLEAIFGDQAVRQLADLSRRDLLDRVRGLLEEEAGRYLAVLDAAGVDADAGHRLAQSAREVEAAHRANRDIT